MTQARLLALETGSSSCYHPTVNSNRLTQRPSPRLSRQFPSLILALALAAVLPGLVGCRTPAPDACQKPAAATVLASTNSPAAATSLGTNQPVRTAKRYNYTPRPYPVDERGFSPIDKALAKAYAREDLVKDDAEGSLNPYVLK